LVSFQQTININKEKKKKQQRKYISVI